MPSHRRTFNPGCSGTGGVLGRDPFRRAIAVYAHNLLARTSLLRAPRSRLRSIDQCSLLVAMGRATAASPPRAVRGATCGRGASPERGRRRSAAPGAAAAVAGVVPGVAGQEPTGEAMRALLRAYLRREGRDARRPPEVFDPVRRNLAVIARLVGLDEVETDVLRFVLAMWHSTPLAEICELFGEVTLAGATEVIGAAIARPAGRVQAALRPEATLLRCGLLVTPGYTEELPRKVDLKDGLLELALAKRLDRSRVLARYLPVAKATTLGADDYGAAWAEAEVARDLLRRALDARRSGVNVLLHGPTGTGKSELARLLAAEVGADLFVVGRQDAAGGSPTAQERIASLRLGHQLLGGTRALVLFDEVEDLFEWSGTGSGHRHASGILLSKQWFNDLLENNPVPTLWITNAVDGIDPAFLRRFGFAIELRPAGARQRAKVLTRHLGRRHRLAKGDVDAIAERFRASPAQIGSAVAVAQLVSPAGKPDRACLEKVLRPVEKLVTGVDPARRPVFEAGTYALDALHASEDLAVLADRLSAWTPDADPGVSMVLHGPPGTGKSEFVKYLAHRMDRRVVQRRVSDIQSKWVGETERNIAEAFREAEGDDAILLFDEADTFLRDRRGATRSWEVSEVNEFLQQLESFRGVVACTTNLRETLDQAALRRFVFKVEFRFLRPAQAARLFSAIFGDLLVSTPGEEEQAAVRRTLERLPRLAAGDFAAVARRFRALGARPGALEAVSALEAEVGLKRVPRPVGF